MRKLYPIVNRWLDQLARPRLAVFKYRASSYRIFGYVGIALALILNTGLIAHQNLSFWIMAVLTANALVGDRERFLQAGMDDYMSKPIDQGKLIEKLKARASLKMSVVGA